MGFFGSLFGWDKSMGAVNAVLGSRFSDVASSPEKKRVAAEIAKIVQSVRAGQTTSKALQDLSQEPRIVQTNFIALACDNLGIGCPVRGNVWTRVTNPYSIGAQISDTDVAVAVMAISKQDGVNVVWPGNGKKINFSAWFDA